LELPLTPIGGNALQGFATQLLSLEARAERDRKGGVLCQSACAVAMNLELAPHAVEQEPLIPKIEGDLVADRLCAGLHTRSHVDSLVPLGHPKRVVCAVLQVSLRNDKVQLLQNRRGPRPRLGLEKRDVLLTGVGRGHFRIPVLAEIDCVGLHFVKYRLNTRILNAVAGDELTVQGIEPCLNKVQRNAVAHKVRAEVCNDLQFQGRTRLDHYRLIPVGIQVRHALLPVYLAISNLRLASVLGDPIHVRHEAEADDVLGKILIPHRGHRQAGELGKVPAHSSHLVLRQDLVGGAGQDGEMLHRLVDHLDAHGRLGGQTAHRKHLPALKILNAQPSKAQLTKRISRHHD